MTQYKHIDFEIPQWGELTQGPAAVPGLLTTMLASGPAGLWLSPGSGGAWLDLSGNARHGTTNNVTYSGSGPLARLAVVPGQFAGGSYVDMGVQTAISQADSVSCEAWAMQTSSFTAFHNLVCAEGYSLPYGIALRYFKTSKEWAYIVDNVRVLYFVETNPPMNVWRHYVGTYNYATGVICIYINGQVMATQALTPGRTKVNNLLRIGNWSSYPAYGDRYWPGRIALTAVYPQALGAATIAQHYRLGVQGP